MTEKKGPQYIGDGVTAFHDGYQIWLETPRENGVHQIALEPDVFVRLLEYARKFGILKSYELTQGGGK